MGKINCIVCGKEQEFNDEEPIRKICSVDCIIEYNKTHKKKIVLHKHYAYETACASVNTTMCFRDASVSQGDLHGGMNIAERNEDVTCKFCLNRMLNRGYISTKEYIERKLK